MSYICVENQFKQINMKRFKGMITAPFTGFTDNGGVDLQKVALQQQYYKDNNIKGVFICGSTGEAPSLTMEEKKSLFKEWAKYRTDDFAVIAFLGGTSVKECSELARYAQECELDAVAVTAPYYFKPSSVDALCEFCRQVALATPDMPFFYYHIPCLTGVNFSMYELLQKMDVVIPNLAGLKYTFENLMDYQLCLNFKDRKYNIMWGRDEMLLSALVLGAEAYVGSTYGYNAPVYTAIIDHFNKGEWQQAADLQLTANKLIEMLGKYGNGCGKAFMKLAGMDLGPTRSPLNQMNDEQIKALRADLDLLSFDQYKCKFK